MGTLMIERSYRVRAMIWTEDYLNQSSCYDHRTYCLLRFQATSTSYVSSLQMTKPTCPRPNQSSPEKSQDNPEHAQLLPMVDEWVLNPRAAVRRSTKDHGTTGGPEQASKGIKVSFRQPPTTDLNFSFPSPTVYLAFSGSLIDSHLGG